MAGFMYFFPRSTERAVEKGTLNLQLLKELGIDSVFKESMDSPSTCIVAKCEGPRNLPGVTVYPKPTHREEPPHVSYNEQSQLWFDREGFWIGVEKGNEPTPADLQREKMFQFPGFVLDDQNNNQWHLPIVCVPDGYESALPVSYGFDPKGKLLSKIKGEFQSTWDLAREAVDYLQAVAWDDDIEKKWPTGVIIKMAIEFLAINYRLTYQEVGVLYEIDKVMIDQTFAGKVLSAVTNYGVWLEYSEAIAKPTPGEKKNPRLSAVG